jgi:hypothetical protein
MPMPSALVRVVSLDRAEKRKLLNIFSPAVLRHRDRRNQPAVAGEVSCIFISTLTTLTTMTNTDGTGTFWRQGSFPGPDSPDGQDRRIGSKSRAHTFGRFKIECFRPPAARAGRDVSDTVSPTFSRPPISAGLGKGGNGFALRRGRHELSPARRVRVDLRM